MQSLCRDGLILPMFGPTGYEHSVVATQIRLQTVNLVSRWPLWVFVISIDRSTTVAVAVSKFLISHATLGTAFCTDDVWVNPPGDRFDLSELFGSLAWTVPMAAHDHWLSIDSGVITSVWLLYSPISRTLSPHCWSPSIPGLLEGESLYRLNSLTHSCLRVTRADRGRPDVIDVSNGGGRLSDSHRCSELSFTHDSPRPRFSFLCHGS